MLMNWRPLLVLLYMWSISDHGPVKLHHNHQLSVQDTHCALIRFAVRYHRQRPGMRGRRPWEQRGEWRGTRGWRAAPRGTTRAAPATLAAHSPSTGGSAASVYSQKYINTYSMINTPQRMYTVQCIHIYSAAFVHGMQKCLEKYYLFFLVY